MGQRQYISGKFMQKKDKMDKRWFIAIIPGVIAVMILVFIIVLFVIKFLWGWIVPDLFPGAVSQGLVAASIGWYTSFKIAIVMGLLSGMFKAQKDHSEWKHDWKGWDKK